MSTGFHSPCFDWPRRLIPKGDAFWVVIGEHAERESQRLGKGVRIFEMQAVAPLVDRGAGQEVHAAGVGAMRKRNSPRR